MIARTKLGIKITIVLLIGLLTFNIVYDVGISNSVKVEEKERKSDITDLDKVKSIAEENVTSSQTKRPTAVTEMESGKSKAFKYISIVGILIIAIAMLIILSKKEDLDD